MDKLAIALTVVMLFQLILSVYQIRYYQGFMGNLVKKYQDTQDFQLVSEVTKSLWSSSVVALIFNQEREIVEAYSLDGMTIFSKFKPYQELIGQKLDEQLLTVIEGKETAKTRAVKALIAKYK